MDTKAHIYFRDHLQQTLAIPTTVVRVCLKSIMDTKVSWCNVCKLKNASNIMVLDYVKSKGNLMSKCSILHVQVHLTVGLLHLQTIGKGAPPEQCVKRIHSGHDSCDHKYYILVGPDIHDSPCG